MARCHQISTESPEDDNGLDDTVTESGQAISEIALDREHRRRQQGYLAPAAAAAFLAQARRMRAGDTAAPPELDPAPGDYLRKRRIRPEAGSLEVTRGQRNPSNAEPVREPADNEEAAILEMIGSRGVLPEARRLPLPGKTAGGDNRLAIIRAQLSFAQEHDDSAYLQRMNEVGYLANVLMAGCSFQSRRFRAAEAADAVYSLCNLGLQNWSEHWRSTEPESRRDALPADFLLRQDLVTPFKIGWRLVHEEVCLHTARRLAEVISNLVCDDREIQDELTDLGQRLRSQVKAGTPWLERDNLDVIAILDQPAWAVLLGLLDECPVAPLLEGSSTSGKQRLRISSRYEFFSVNSQILWAHAFVESLPALLV
jgi:hypothetical protein